MASIIMSKPASKLDPAIKKKAYAFLEKLTDDDTAPGLHIEPISNSADAIDATKRLELMRILLSSTSSAGARLVELTKEPGARSRGDQEPRHACRGRDRAPGAR